MASGRLGASDISAGATDNLVYTVPVDNYAVATPVCNRGNRQSR